MLFIVPISKPIEHWFTMPYPINSFVSWPLINGKPGGNFHLNEPNIYQKNEINNFVTNKNMYLLYGYHKSHD